LSRAVIFACSAMVINLLSTFLTVPASLSPSAESRELTCVGGRLRQSIQNFTNMSSNYFIY
jgi:hypothetical protein